MSNSVRPHRWQHLTSHSRMSGSRWVITPSWLPGLWRSFLYRSSVYSCNLFLISYASVQFSSVAQLCPTLCNPWTAAGQASLSFIISWSLLKLMSIESMMPSNHLILCCPLPLLPSIFPSIIFFSSDSAHRIWWPKYWNLSFSIILSMNIQGWFPLGLNGLISLKSMGLSRIISRTTIQKHQFFNTQPS